MRFATPLNAAAGCFAGALALGAGAAAQTAQPAPAAVAADDSGSVTDIVVTSDRRLEKLQDVPSSVTVLSGDTLARLGVEDFKDYVSLVPGLSQRDYGNPGQGTIVLRGLTTGPQQLSNTAAYYIDDIPFSPNSYVSLGSLVAPDFDLADANRIEVLKGPQGTLYGANSLGGIVQLVSEKPNLEQAGGFVRGETAFVSRGDVGGGFRAVVNAPIIEDELGARLNLVYNKETGFVDDVGTGKSNANESEIKGGRLAVRWKPDDKLTVDVTGLTQDILNDGFAFQDDVTGTLKPIYGQYKYKSIPGVGSQLHYRIAAGTATYDLDPITVIASASFAKYSTRNVRDVSESYIPYFGAIPGFGALVPPGSVGTAAVSPNLNKESYELRAVSKRIGPVEFVSGVFYTAETTNYDEVITVYPKLYQPIYPPFLKTGTESKYHEAAGYGNLTFYVTDDFDLTGGLRYSHADTTAGSPEATFFGSQVPPSFFTGGDDDVTYLATLRWRLTQALSTYFRFATGYRPGGPQRALSLPAGIPQNVAADTTQNFEVGAKGSVLDGRMSFEGSVYHIDWDRIQLSALSQGLSFTANGGSATVDGAELEVDGRPLPGMTVGLTAGYTDAHLGQVSPAVSASVYAYPGDRLPLTPRWTTALWADQTFPVAEGVSGSVGATLRYRSSFPTSYPLAALNPNVNVPPLATLDLRGSLVFERFSLDLSVENLTNALGVTTVYTDQIYPRQPVTSEATLIRPLTVHLGATVPF